MIIYNPKLQLNLKEFALLLALLIPAFWTNTVSAANSVKAFTDINNWSDLTDEEVCELSWGLTADNVGKKYLDDFAMMAQIRELEDCIYFDFLEDQPGLIEFERTGLPYWCERNLNPQSISICRAAREAFLENQSSKSFFISLEVNKIKGDFEFNFPTHAYYPFSIKSTTINDFSMSCSDNLGGSDCVIKYFDQKINFSHECEYGGEFQRSLKILNYDFRNREWSFNARDRHEFGYLDGDLISKEFAGYWGFYTDYYEPNMSPAFYNQPIFNLIQHRSDEQDTLVLFEMNCGSNLHFFNLRESLYEKIPSNGAIPKFITDNQGRSSHILHKGGLAFYCCGACAYLELDLTHKISVLSDEKTKFDLHKILREEFLKEHYKALNKPFDLKDFNILAALLDKYHFVYQKDVCLNPPYGEHWDQETEKQYFLLETLLQRYAKNLARGLLFNDPTFEKKMKGFERLTTNRLMVQMRLEVQRSVDELFN